MVLNFKVCTEKEHNVAPNSRYALCFGKFLLSYFMILNWFAFIYSVMGSMRGVSRKQCQHQICSFSVGRSYVFAQFGLLRFICDVTYRNNWGVWCRLLTGQIYPLIDWLVRIICAGINSRIQVRKSSWHLAFPLNFRATSFFFWFPLACLLVFILLIAWSCMNTAAQV